MRCQFSELPGSNEREISVPARVGEFSSHHSEFYELSYYGLIPFIWSLNIIGHGNIVHTLFFWLTKGKIDCYHVTPIEFTITTNSGTHGTRDRELSYLVGEGGAWYLLEASDPAQQVPLDPHSPSVHDAVPSHTYTTFSSSP